MATTAYLLDTIKSLTVLLAAREGVTPQTDMNKLRDEAQAKLDGLRNDLGTVTLPRY